MRTRTERTRRLPAALLCFLPAVGLADTETVTLNGKTYEVETSRGYPVPASSPDVDMKGLGAISGTPENPDSMAWMWDGTVQRDGSFSVTVTTPLDDAVSTSFEVAGREEANRFLFASADYPSVWAWLDAEGTSWFPLVFDFRDQASGESFEVTQWLRFDDDSKAAFRALRAAESFVVQTSRGKATVYVLRGSNMRMQGQLDLFVDETPVATLPRLSYVSFEVDPGWHLMWGDCPAQWFELEAGRAYLLRILTGVNAGQACITWMVGTADAIGADVAQLGLELVVPSEDSLVELRAKTDGYARARKRAGDPPAGLGPIIVEELTYSEEPPGAFAAAGFGFGSKHTGSLTLGDATLSYDSSEQQLEIPLADIRSFRTTENCVRINYGPENASRRAYFCSLTTSSLNRVLMHLVNSAPP